MTTATVFVRRSFSHTSVRTACQYGWFWSHGTHTPQTVSGYQWSSNSFFHVPRMRLSSLADATPGKSAENTFDYIVVGAGSAGCVLANRLSANSDNRVMLLEAGGKDHSWKFGMPAALMYTLKDPKLNWCYCTAPQANVNQRSMYWPRGKVWGGCSSHNAMVWLRGNALDYDRWESEGATGWSYADCLPYFKKSETFERGEDTYRGGSGPLMVTQGRMKNPLFQAFLNSGKEAGYPLTDDMNGFQQEGFGGFDMSINKGVRSSSSRAFLWPVLSRNNLSTKNRIIVHRVLFDGTRAVGVEIREKGTLKKLYAEREVILSAGAINSPQLLMLSGIGNSEDVHRVGIKTVVELPGVGQNMQDHLDYYFQVSCTKPITLYKYQWKFPWNMVKAGLHWFYNQGGDAATTHIEAGAFIRSDSGISHPDLQLHFLPSVVIDHGQKMGHCHAYQIHASPMRPTSLGSLRVVSRDPEVAPLIQPNYLATEKDRSDYVRMIRLVREVMMQKPFDEFRREELQPGAASQSDEELLSSIQEVTDTAYHPSCTAKMGHESDKMAVVSPQCNVFGVENLRVVDASIMPSIVSANLNATVIMMAEKAADIILGESPLPRADVPVYQPESTDSQR